MFTYGKTTLGTVSLAALAAVVLFAGSSAMANDRDYASTSRASNNAYSEFDENDSMGLLDAVNRDYPVTPVRNPDVAHRYRQYDEHDSMGLLDAVNRDYPVTPVRNPDVAHRYRQYDDHDSVGLIDAVNRDHLLQ